MTISQVYSYYKERISEVRRFVETFGSGDLWSFLMAASFIDYLVKMIYNKEGAGSKEYKAFIREYLSLVNRKYVDFTYKSGYTDLPEQMYHVLRCGITHSHSLFPDTVSQKKGGRSRSILLAHRKNGAIHLEPYDNENFDSVIFTMEDFIEDLEKVLDEVFTKKAISNTELSENIASWVKKYPPIMKL